MSIFAFFYITFTYFTNPTMIETTLNPKRTTIS